MQAVIPIDPANPGGAAITLDETCFEVLGDRGDVVVVKFHSFEVDPTRFMRTHSPGCKGNCANA